MPTRFTVLTIMLCVVVEIIASPPAATGQDSRDILISGVSVVDVEGGRCLQPQQVLISKNRILAVGKELEFDENNVLRLELNGMFVFPGFIDLHSHLLLHPYNETSWNDQVLKESLELRVIRGTTHALNNLKAGFTTVRDLGTEGAGFADVALRDAIAQGLIPGPRIFAVTKALVTTGGYGPSGFDPRFSIPKGAQIADGVDGVRRATREQIAAGADWIKVYADYRRKEGDVSTPTFSPEELSAIVDEAKSAGLKVSAHATTDAGIRRAVQAGVATIEHGYEASLESLRMMKNSGVVLCPTLAASEAMAIYSGWSPSEPDHPRIVLAKQLMKNALESGVKIACGSDVGVFAHGDNVRELELMYAYGMSAADVLRASTIDASRVLGMEKELGLVVPNFLADLVVVGQNPLEDISAIRKPLIVIKDGKIVFDGR